MVQAKHRTSTKVPSVSAQGQVGFENGNSTGRASSEGVPLGTNPYVSTISKHHQEFQAV
jgi:hypothetical protein